MGAAKRLDKDSIRRAVARNLKHKRMTAEPRLSQGGVAKLFAGGMSRAAVGAWEVGDALPDVDKLAVLARAFGCSIDSLVFGDEYLGDKAKRGKELTQEALTLAQDFDAMVSPRQRELILSLVKTMAEQAKRK